MILSDQQIKESQNIQKMEVILNFKDDDSNGQNELIWQQVFALLEVNKN